MVKKVYTKAKDMYIYKICKYTLVKNKYTKMYLKYIYFIISILQIHLCIYVQYLIKIPCSCTFGLLNWYI